MNTEAPIPEEHGGPAFPQVIVGKDNTIYMQQGMSLRDYFAAMAMQAWMHRHGDSEAGTAEAAFDYADAMLAARKEKP